MNNQARIEIITAALVGRDQEVMAYQVNIDNYTLALQHISQLPTAEQQELADFTNQLKTLLASEQLEQKKSKVMQAVLRQQLE